MARSTMDLDLSALQEHKKNPRVRRRIHLSSSIFFFLGCTVWTVSFSVASGNKSSYQILTYGGLALLMLHALIELFLDIWKPRGTLHSRYGSSRWSNILQSLAFCLAVGAEGTYFYFYMEELYHRGDWYDISRDVYLGASQMWMLTSILTFYGRGCLVSGAGLDNNANILYFFGACGMLVSGWVEWFQEDDIEFFIKWVSVLVWIVAGVLYTTRDYLQLTRPSSNKKVPLHSLADTISVGDDL